MAAWGCSLTYWCPHGLDSRESYICKQHDSIGIREINSILFSCFNFLAQIFFYSYILNSSLRGATENIWPSLSRHSWPLFLWWYEKDSWPAHSLSIVKNFMVLLVKSGPVSCQLINSRLFGDRPFTDLIVTTGDSLWDRSFLNSTKQQASACFPSSKSRYESPWACS